LRGGSLHKAGKGELRLPLPAGFQYDETGRLRVTPDEAVADAIKTVSSYFDQLQSARQVMLRLLAEDRQLPRRASADRHVRWVPATYKAIHDILTNPVFAGAYAYGRQRTERRVDVGVVSEGSVARRARSGTCASKATTPDTSPSSAISPPSSGCAPTGVHRAGRAAAPRARAGRCSRD
jgi:Recombinase